MFSWIDILAQRERYEERQREVERYRLIRQVTSGCARYRRLHHRVFAWLGQRLLVLGGRLQEQYGVATASPALRATDRA